MLLQEALRLKRSAGLHPIESGIHIVEAGLRIITTRLRRNAFTGALTQTKDEKVKLEFALGSTITAGSRLTTSAETISVAILAQSVAPQRFFKS